MKSSSNNVELRPTFRVKHPSNVSPRGERVVNLLNISLTFKITHIPGSIEASLNGRVHQTLGHHNFNHSNHDTLEEDKGWRWRDELKKGKGGYAEGHNDSPPKRKGKAGGFTATTMGPRNFYFR